MLEPVDGEPRRVGTIWTLSLDEPSPAITPLVEAAIRLAGPADIPALAAAMGGEAAPEIRRRFEAGRRCFAAWSAGQLAAYGWVSCEAEFVGELQLRLRLLPGEAYIWDCATLPAFRQKHLYSALLAYILDQLRADGDRRAWIGADKDNVPSQRGFARAGFHPVADLAIAQVNGRRAAWLIGWPGVPEDLVAEARRVYLGSRDQVWLDALSSPETPRQLRDQSRVAWDLVAARGKPSDRRDDGPPFQASD